MFGQLALERLIRYCVYQRSTLDCLPNRKDTKERRRIHMPKVPYAVARSESPNLDFLRAVAVMSVYVFHLLYTVGLSHIPTPDVHPDFGWFLGRFGVLIFFVHTSLVPDDVARAVGPAGPPFFPCFLCPAAVSHLSAQYGVRRHHRTFSFAA